MNHIHLSSKTYDVIVLFDDDTTIKEVTAFEDARIQSLLDRDFQVRTEMRTWDDKRKISVSVRRQ